MDVPCIFYMYVLDIFMKENYRDMSVEQTAYTALNKNYTCYKAPRLSAKYKRHDKSCMELFRTISNNIQ